MGFSKRTIAIVRRRVEAFLTERCDLSVQGTSVGDMGQPLATWTVVAADVTCRIIRAGSTFASTNTITGGREALVDTLRLIVPHETEIAADYRVQVEGGHLYEVVEVLDDLTDEAFVQAIIKRLRRAS